MTDFKSKFKMFGKLMISDIDKCAVQEKIVLNYVLTNRTITLDFMKENTRLSEGAILNAFENLDNKELIEYDRQQKCLRIRNFKKFHSRKTDETFVE